MNFIGSFVTAEIGRMRASPQARERACGDNLHFERRLSDQRAEDYARAVERHRGVLGKIGVAETLEAAHQGYFDAFVSGTKGQLPAAFTPANDSALLPGLGESRRLVRLEDLSGWFSGFPHPIDPAAFEASFSRLEGPELRAYVQAMMDDWNTLRDPRPMFAALRDDVLALLGPDDAPAPNWAYAMRDHLGQGHLTSRRLLVGLMDYTVADVLAEVPEDERRHAFAAPTALDQGGFCEHFYPTPLLPSGPGVSWGRTVHLRADGSKLVSELLHRRVTYRPEHLVRLAWLDPAHDPCGSAYPPLWEMRNRHRAKLVGKFGDFGEDMKADGNVA